jgi:hypothetical protein
MSDTTRNLEITLPMTSLELKHPRGYINKQTQKLRIRSAKFLILLSGGINEEIRGKLIILFVHSDKYGNLSHYPASCSYVLFLIFPEFPHFIMSNCWYSVNHHSGRGGYNGNIGIGIKTGSTVRCCNHIDYQVQFSIYFWNARATLCQNI